jgi:hypothetical protein
MVESGMVIVKAKKLAGEVAWLVLVDDLTQCAYKKNSDIQ